MGRHREDRSAYQTATLGRRRGDDRFLSHPIRAQQGHGSEDINLCCITVLLPALRSSRGELTGLNSVSPLTLPIS